MTLRPVPHLAFEQDGSLGVRPNQLVLTIQPNEGVSLSLGAKIPGTRMRIRPVNMEFLYGTAFLSQSPEAYERLILDAMRGEATLFTRNDEVEAQWRICDPIVSAWEADAGAAAVRRGHAGTRRGGRAPAGGPRVARDLSARRAGRSGRRRGRGGGPCRPSDDTVWAAQNTTPAAIEAALRELLIERHSQSDGYVPARVLNLVCIVDRAWSGEIANRLRGVGRYHPSRTIVCAVSRRAHDDRRRRLDRRATRRRTRASRC